jgi:hypothetical protein
MPVGTNGCSFRKPALNAVSGEETRFAPGSEPAIAPN